jgi:lipoteichoic acid synthase
MSKDIPLYLVNIPSEIKSKMWTGECNQIDVYTTLLNLLGIESEWYGLGESLLSPYDQNTIDAKTWDFSEWIIRGNYFSPSGG